MERPPIRVLHVEDNEFFALVASNVLAEEHPDVSVTSVSTADEALSRLEAEPFDCVVSDYELPGMDGLELLGAIRERYPEIPFVLMTGGGSEETASDAISAGVTDYLRKGSGRRQFVVLANRIENAVSRRRAEKAVRRQIDINDLIWDVSQTLLQASTHEDIEREVCQRLADSESYLFAWIGKVDESGHVVPQFSGGIEEGYLDAVYREGGAPERNADEETKPVYRAVETGEIQIAQDIATWSSSRSWREKALERGYGSKAAIPLDHGDTLYGVLNVYADRPYAFGSAERRVLSKFGNSIAYAMSSVRTRQELVRREQRLQVFNRILRHNLRNDLNVVLGHAENLREEVPRARDSADVIHRKATELVDISEKAREVGRTLDGPERTRGAIEVTTIVERASADLDESNPNVELSMDAPDATWVYGDKTLGAAIGEILENAVEHSDRDAPSVRVTVESDGNGWVEITVVDDGPGIPEAERSVLDEGQETDLHHGSGLGLWLTNWVVGKLGGELTFAANHPRGSVVTVRLRRAEPRD